MFFACFFPSKKKEEFLKPLTTLKITTDLEDKRMASRLIRNQLPSNGLRVRPPCPPLLSKEAQGYRKGLWKKASRSTPTVVRRPSIDGF